MACLVLFGLMEFNGMSTDLALFHAKSLGNKLCCTSTIASFLGVTLHCIDHVYAYIFNIILFL